MLFSLCEIIIPGILLDFIPVILAGIKLIWFNFHCSTQNEINMMKGSILITGIKANNISWNSGSLLYSNILLIMFISNGNIVMVYPFYIPSYNNKYRETQRNNTQWAGLSMARLSMIPGLHHDGFLMIPIPFHAFARHVTCLSSININYHSIFLPTFNWVYDVVQHLIRTCLLSQTWWIYSETCDQTPTSDDRPLQLLIILDHFLWAHGC